MHEKYKDTDLREALRRKYGAHPQSHSRASLAYPSPFPKGWKPERLSALMSNEKRVSKSFGWWRLAAACLLIIAGVGLTMLHKEEPAKTERMIVKQTKPVPVLKEKTDSSKVQNSQFQSSKLEVLKEKTAPKQVPMKWKEAKTKTYSAQETHSEQAVVDPNLHYAAHAPAEETVPNQDPARVDEFIEKMAAYHNVKEGELKCAATNDSNVVSRVYVFPDKKEIDVFGRLLQVACWYSDETPGYRLNFSHQQFFFELKDQRKQLQYRWIAERMNGKILLYGTNAPIGAKTSSACYQEYRDELMHSKSINYKTREI